MIHKSNNKIKNRHKNAKKFEKLLDKSLIMQYNGGINEPPPPHTKEKKKMEKIKAATIETPDSPELRQTIFYGIEWLYGGWMITTCGDPATLNDYENRISEAEDADEYAAIEAEKNAIEELIERDEGEDITAEQLVYLNEWREIWGL